MGTGHAAVDVDALGKVFKVPVRESGLKAAAKSLVKRTHRDVVAVGAVSFRIEPGEIVGFLGPNGAGKTTTVRMLAALIAPTGGAASVAGHRLGEEDRAIRSAVGILTETPGLYEGLSAFQNGDVVELETEGLGRLRIGVRDDLKRTWARETRLDRQEKGLDGTTPQLTGKHAPAAR